MAELRESLRLDLPGVASICQAQVTGSMLTRCDKSGSLIWVMPPRQEPETLYVTA
jgi:hypothetical protein